MGRGGRGQREGEEVNGEKDRLETDCMVERKDRLEARENTGYKRQPFPLVLCSLLH